MASPGQAPRPADGQAPALSFPTRSEQTGTRGHCGGVVVRGAPLSLHLLQAGGLREGSPALHAGRDLVDGLVELPHPAGLTSGQVRAPLLE